MTTYAFLGIGSNKTIGARTLRHAERGVVRLGVAMTGALGTIPSKNASFIVANPTKRQIDAALRKLRRQRPDYLALPISGHGNASGFGASDGLYAFDRLRDEIGEIGARGTVVVVNTCGAGGFAKSGTVVGGIELEPVADPRWAAQLLESVEGVRTFMATGANDSTWESARGSWFVEALLSAMHYSAPGDLGLYGEFISDKLVFDRAFVEMKRVGVHPIARGLFGDFPLMRANVASVGRAVVALRAAPNLGARVQMRVQGRRHLATRIIVTPIDGFGNRLPPSTKVVFAWKDDVLDVMDAVVDRGVSPGCLQQLWWHGACRVTWEVDVRDQEMRRITCCRFNVDYVEERLCVSW
jgi:hypothetical protein